MADKQKTGVAATIAIIAAIGGIIASLAGHPFWGFLILAIAIIAGLAGMAMSASPKVGGGLMSLVAVVIAVFGLGLSVLVMVGVIVF